MTRYQHNNERKKVASMAENVTAELLVVAGLALALYVLAPNMALGALIAYAAVWVYRIVLLVIRRGGAR